MFLILTALTVFMLTKPSPKTSQAVQSLFIVLGPSVRIKKGFLFCQRRLGLAEIVSQITTAPEINLHIFKHINDVILNTISKS